MKKNYLFIVFAFAFTFQTFAQLSTVSKGLINKANYKEINAPKPKSSNDLIYLNDSSINYFWDLTSNSWDSHMKTINSFDNRGNLVLAIYYMKDYSTLQFKINEKSTYTYNSSDQLIMDVFSWWDESTLSWID